MARDSDLAKLRRARSRAHFALKQAETLAQTYRDKVAGIEAAIQAIAPDLQLPARLRNPNPIFARGELRRLAIDILREADGPVSVRDMALGALKAKGVRFPDRHTMKRTRIRVREIMGGLERRGVARTVGMGKGTRRVLVGE